MNGRRRGDVRTFTRKKYKTFFNYKIFYYGRNTQHDVYVFKFDNSIRIEMIEKEGIIILDKDTINIDGFVFTGNTGFLDVVDLAIKRLLIARNKFILK
jgi:hypothetical protein